MATLVGVWVCNLVTDRIWWNENLFTLLGFTQELVAPPFSKWIKRIHPCDRSKLITKRKQISEHQILSWEDEFRFLQADGSYGTVLDRAYILQDESGNPVRVIGALVDITQQKRDMQELEVLSLVAKETSSSVMGSLTKQQEIFHGLTKGLAATELYGSRFAGDRWQNALDIIGRSGKWTGTASGTIYSHIKNDLPFSCDLLIYMKKRCKNGNF